RRARSGATDRARAAGARRRSTAGRYDPDRPISISIPRPGERPSVNPICPYCSAGIESPGEGVFCQCCGAAHHRECWEENGGCTVVGCAAAPADEPKITVSLEGPQPGSAAAPPPPSLYPPPPPPPPPSLYPPPP